MARRVMSWIALLLCGLPLAPAADRMAVLEFFGKPQGDYCRAAGPALRQLQQEYDGRALLLEYDYDQFPIGRQDRFWETGVSARFLPLVMVGCGFGTSSGHVDYESVYRGMLDNELERPPRAAVTAFWRQVEGRMRAYVTLANTGSDALSVQKEAAIWLIVFDRARVGVSDTWVRATMRWPLSSDLPSGATLQRVIDSPVLPGAGWDTRSVALLVEDRLSAVGRYDMLQATEALPASIRVSPERIEVCSWSDQHEVHIDGPHVLAWTAVADAPWIDVLPEAGVLPATVAVSIRPELRPPGETMGTVRVYATGDGMSLETAFTVEVRVPSMRLPAGRLAPAASSSSLRALDWHP